MAFDTTNGGMVTVGLNHMLDVEYHATTVVDPWYVMLIDNASWTAFAAADVLAGHAGWIEYTDYTGSRKAFVEGAAAAGVINNTGNEASFAITGGGGTIKGAALCSVATTTTGVLSIERVFTAGNRPVIAGDTLTVGITITLTPV